MAEPVGLLGRGSSSRMTSHSSSRSESNRGSSSQQGGVDSSRYHVDSNTRGGRRSRRGGRNNNNKEGGSGLDALTLALSLKQPSLYEDISSLISTSLPIFITMIPWVIMKVRTLMYTYSVPTYT